MDYKKFYKQNKNYIKGAIIVLFIVFSGVLYYMRTYEDRGRMKDSFDASAPSLGTGQTEEQAESDAEHGEENIYVYVCGCVNMPGVVECKKQTRVFEVIEMCGGFSDNAAKEALNLADIVEDSEQIYVPSKDEDYVLPHVQDTGNGLININKADQKQLMTLPGIGESRAADIIDYRERLGGFETVEDIMKVSGIKESAYSKIKDLICV